MKSTAGCLIFVGLLSDIVSSPSDGSDFEFQANEESDETGSIVSLLPTQKDRTTPPPPSQS